VGLSEISLRILELLKTHPEGLTSGEIREKLGIAAGEHAQLDRRRRDLYKFHIVEKIGTGTKTRVRPSLSLARRGWTSGLLLSAPPKRVILRSSHLRSSPALKRERLCLGE
jgi:hypothetical protein